MKDGTTELLLRRERSVVVVEGVPALVCPQCGEASIAAETSQGAYELAEKEINRGVALEFCKFRVA
ncbi:MAG: hypothetical protein C5B49_03180 [Bdellovibrio sp.]|nr:MAG: hypothetical protein C5B49_03180 [Bdellovibrio sp.]